MPRIYRSLVDRTSTRKIRRNNAEAALKRIEKELSTLIRFSPNLTDLFSERQHILAQSTAKEYVDTALSLIGNLYIK